MIFVADYYHPAAVKEFIDTGSFLTVKDLQGRILNEYIADMAKYALVWS
jgi:hypothetical protein